MEDGQGRVIYGEAYSRLQFLSSIEEAEAGTGTVQLAEVSLSLSTALGARRPLPSRTRGVTVESPG